MNILKALTQYFSAMFDTGDIYVCTFSSENPIYIRTFLGLRDFVIDGFSY